MCCVHSDRSEHRRCTLIRVCTAVPAPPTAFHCTALLGSPGVCAPRPQHPAQLARPLTPRLRFAAVPAPLRSASAHFVRSPLSRSLPSLVVLRFSLVRVVSLSLNGTVLRSPAPGLVMFNPSAGLDAFVLSVGRAAAPRPSASQAAQQNEYARQHGWHVFGPPARLGPMDHSWFPEIEPPARPREEAHASASAYVSASASARDRVLPPPSALHGDAPLGNGSEQEKREVGVRGHYRGLPGNPNEKIWINRYSKEIAAASASASAAPAAADAEPDLAQYFNQLHIHAPPPVPSCSVPYIQAPSPSAPPRIQINDPVQSPPAAAAAGVSHWGLQRNAVQPPQAAGPNINIRAAHEMPAWFNPHLAPPVINFEPRPDQNAAPNQKQCRAFRPAPQLDARGAPVVRPAIDSVEARNEPSAWATEQVSAEQRKQLIAALQRSLDGHPLFGAQVVESELEKTMRTAELRNQPLFVRNANAVGIFAPPGGQYRHKLPLSIVAAALARLPGAKPSESRLDEYAVNLASPENCHPDDNTQWMNQQDSKAERELLLSFHLRTPLSLTAHGVAHIRAAFEFLALSDAAQDFSTAARRQLLEMFTYVRDEHGMPFLDWSMCRN